MYFKTIFFSSCFVVTALVAPPFTSSIVAPSVTLDPHVALFRTFLLPPADILDQRLSEKFGSLGIEDVGVSLGAILGEQKLSPFKVYDVVFRYASANFGNNLAAYAHNPVLFGPRLLMAHTLCMQREGIIRCIFEDNPIAVATLEQTGFLSGNRGKQRPPIARLPQPFILRPDFSGPEFF